MIRKFESFSAIQDVMDLRSHIEDEFPDLKLSEVTDLGEEIPGGGSWTSNPISFKIILPWDNSPPIYAFKRKVLLKVSDIIDLFEKTYDGLKFEFLLVWVSGVDRYSRGEWYDIKTTKEFREKILSGEFTNPVEVTLVFSGYGTLHESIDYGSLGDIFYPLEDTWNIETLIMSGVEIKSKIAGEAQIVSLGEVFKDDPYHFYFYQEGGNDVGLWQTFTDGEGYDVMGMERKLLIMRPPNWISGGKISFNYELIDKVLSGVGENFSVKEKNEYTLVKIEVSGEEFSKNPDLIRDIQSGVKMAVNMYGLELFDTKDPYYRNGVFGALEVDKKWGVNWLRDKLDSRKIFSELGDERLSIRICFKGVV